MWIQEHNKEIRINIIIRRTQKIFTYRTNPIIIKEHTIHISNILSYFGKDVFNEIHNNATYPHSCVFLHFLLSA